MIRIFNAEGESDEFSVDFLRIILADQGINHALHVAEGRGEDLDTVRANLTFMFYQVDKQYPDLKLLGPFASSVVAEVKKDHDYRALFDLAILTFETKGAH